MFQPRSIRIWGRELWFKYLVQLLIKMHKMGELSSWKEIDLLEVLEWNQHLSWLSGYRDKSRLLLGWSWPNSQRLANDCLCRTSYIHLPTCSFHHFDFLLETANRGTNHGHSLNDFLLPYNPLCLRFIPWVWSHTIKNLQAGGRVDWSYFGLDNSSDFWNNFSNFYLDSSNYYYGHLNLVLDPSHFAIPNNDLGYSRSFEHN